MDAETTFTQIHAATIGIRLPAVRMDRDGTLDDADVTRFANAMHRWASQAKSADVGTPAGDGWSPIGNPHVDSERPNYVVQMWQRRAS